MAKIEFGPIMLTADRWPWMKRKSSAALCCPKTERVGDRYGWFGTPGMGRFGGGWNWNLGIQIGRKFKSVYFDLLFGMVSFRYRTKEDRRKDEEFKAAQAARRAERKAAQDRRDEIPF